MTGKTELLIGFLAGLHHFGKFRVFHALLALLLQFGKMSGVPSAEMLYGSEVAVLFDGRVHGCRQSFRGAEIEDRVQ